MKKELIDTVVDSIKRFGYVDQSNGDIVQGDNTFEWRKRGYRLLYGEVPGLDVRYESVPELGQDHCCDILTYMKDDVFYVKVYVYIFGEQYDHETVIGFGVYSYPMDSEFGKYYSKYKSEEYKNQCEVLERVHTANNVILGLRIPDGWIVAPDCEYGTYIKIWTPVTGSNVLVDFASNNIQEFIDDFNQLILKYIPIFNIQ